MLLPKIVITYVSVSLVPTRTLKILFSKIIILFLPLFIYLFFRKITEYCMKFLFIANFLIL